MKTVSLTKNKSENFDIILHAASTAGFTWKMQPLPDAIEIVKEYSEPDEMHKSTGDSAKKIFKLKAKRTGEYKVHFLLGRPWENSPIEELVYDITIK